MLNISVKYNIKHFVYASSSSVYGLNQSIPYKESCCADHPVSLYAATKRCDEILAHLWLVLLNPPVEIFYYMVDENPSISSSPFEIYNIGSWNPISLMEYIHYFERTLNKKAIKNNMPMQKGDVEKTYADISKIKNKLNFTPQVYRRRN